MTRFLSREFHSKNFTVGNPRHRLINMKAQSRQTGVEQFCARRLFSSIFAARLPLVQGSAASVALFLYANHGDLREAFLEFWRAKFRSHAQHYVIRHIPFTTPIALHAHFRGHIENTAWASYWKSWAILIQLWRSLGERFVASM